MCLPARTVSGDYFDFLSFTPEIVAVVIGDICGKGISAALLMANLQATLRTHISRMAMEDPEVFHRHLDRDMLSGMIEQINRHIYAFTSPNKFASLFTMVFDRAQRRMTYCNAGHNPPILLKGRKPHYLKTGGTVVGIFPDATFQQESVMLEPGDLMMAYTDGITEAVNEYGDEFGEEQLEQLVIRHGEEPVEDIQKYAIDAVVEWSYGRERDDDMTLVVTRVNDDWISN
jgi:sigma-B regulation protein RsbU (phosphoserine phosphatase)